MMDDATRNIWEGLRAWETVARDLAAALRYSHRAGLWSHEEGALPNTCIGCYALSAYRRLAGEP